MNLIFAGSGAFGIPTLDWLNTHHTVVGVYTQPSKPAGRGLKLTPTPICLTARSLGLNVVETADINAEPLPAADAVVVIALGQKVSPRVATHGRYGAVNLHASLLPRWRGAAPIHHAIWAGDAATGNTVIRLADRMDAGVMLGHTTRPIAPTDTTGRLHDALAADGPALIDQVLTGFVQGATQEIVQDETAITLARKISRASTLVDFNRPATEVSCHIRAMSPSPGCRFRLTGPGAKDAGVVTLHVVQALPGDSTPPCPPATPGQLDDLGHISTGWGSMRVLELQPEGSNTMPLTTYQNGRPWAPGMSLTSIT